MSNFRIFPLPSAWPVNLTARIVIAGLIAATTLTTTGCRTSTTTATPEPVIKDYTRPLPPGTPALRIVDDANRVRSLLTAAYESESPLLTEAAGRSSAWFRKPSARNYFPAAGVSFDQARQGADSWLEILKMHPTREEFISEVMNRFDLYESVGWDGSGEVLFTGYCAMEFDASRTRTGEFQYPLYTKPEDLVVDPISGVVKGRKVGDSFVPYYTRRELESTGMLKGRELVWMKSPLDVYFAQVNGSAKLWLTDGSTMYVGYSGTNGRQYTGLGATMIRRRIVDPSRVGIPFIRDYYEKHPQEVLDMIDDNDRYVFFAAYQSGNWPAGSLGFPVTEMRSLATDKSVFPRGGPVMVETRIPTYGRTLRSFTQLMFDQDTGGAITAPGRADIYMGQGAAASLLAGRQYQEGRLYYFLLKPELVKSTSDDRSKSPLVSGEN